MELLTLLKAIDIGKVQENTDITDIVYDSRKVIPGCVFVCLRGSAVDGHKFAQAACEQGAAAIICEEPVETNCQSYVVGNTKKALALLSAEFFGNPAENGLKIIGITGTKGKTTTAHMIREILECAGHKTGMIGTVGVVIGNETTKTLNTTPASYEVQKFFRKMLDEGCEYCVIEASSIGLKEYRVYGFTFDIGLFTNFSEDHIGGVEHSDMQDYLESKQMLFKMCKTGVVNIDDESCEEIIAGHTCDIRTYGFQENAEFRGGEYSLLSESGFLGLSLNIHGEIELAVKVGIPGKFNAYNALSAVSCCALLEISGAAIEEGLRRAKVKGRVEPVPVCGGYTLLIDYAHNAVSMESLLITLREYNPKRLVCLFGAGGNRPKVRRYEMGEMSGKLADLSVITADNSRFENVLDILADIKIGMHKTEGKYVEIPDRREAIRYCIENAQPGDIIVLAGKGHEDYQEIEGVQYHLDEREVVAEVLASLR
jgi:UDP-N-acetylmuramyl-tripeptide synthetase